MSVSVFFDDNNLSDLIGVAEGYNAFDTAEWDNRTQTVGNGNGSVFTGRTHGIKVVPMPFYIKNDVKNKYDKLLKFLNVSEPKKLTFGNVVNRCYYAVPDGKIEFETLGENAGRGKIMWIVPSGVSESIDTKTVPVQLVNGILTANIDYAGSADAFPVFRIKHNDENGYIGAVSSSGTALELGNRGELDTTKLSEAVTIVDTTTFSEFKQYTGVNPENLRKGNTGTSGIVKEGDTNYWRLNNAGADNGYWHGSSYVFDFPADGTGHVGSKNVYSYFNAVFWAGAMGQTADMQVLFLDSKNQVVMGYDIYKVDTVGNQGVLAMLAGDGKGGVNVLRNEVFTTSHLESQNFFNKPRGDSDIRKNGGNITFYYRGEYPNFYVPELKDIEITKCMINQYQYGDRSGIKLMSYFDFRRLFIVNNDAKYIFDIKNRYEKKSNIVIDNGSAEIFKNGLPKNNELIDGSKFISLKPGQNKIEFYASSWVKSKPTITVEYRERWL